MRTNVNSDPSGVRLLRLINTKIYEIANREIDNENRLCLYGTGGYWTAFDRSAFALSLIFPELPSFVVTPPGSSFSVVGLTVSDRALKCFMRSHSAVRQELDYMEFTVDPIPSEAYESWHSQTVNGYMDIIHAS